MSRTFYDAEAKGGHAVEQLHLHSRFDRIHVNVITLGFPNS
jgi:hypothetical protein